MVLGSTISCHLAQRSGVGGQLATYFLLSLAIPSYKCSNRSNEFDGIQTQNQPVANRGLQQPFKFATWRPLLILRWFYTAVVNYLVFD